MRYPVYKSRVDNPAVANSHPYPLSGTAATVGVLPFCAFPMDIKARYIQCKHRTSNFSITIRRSNRLSYAADYSCIMIPCNFSNYSVYFNAINFILLFFVSSTEYASTGKSFVTTTN